MPPDVPAPAPPPNRIEAIAMLVAARHETVDIARVMGVPLSFVYALKDAPEFQRRVAALRGPENAVKERLDADAPMNVDFLRAVRNGEYAGADAKDTRLRMEAAKALLERQVQRERAETQAPVFNIHIDATRHDAMRATLDADDGPVIDLEALPDDAS